MWRRVVLATATSRSSASGSLLSARDATDRLMPSSSLHAFTSYFTAPRNQNSEPHHAGTMRGVVATGPGTEGYTVREGIPIPVPGDDEVLLRTLSVVRRRRCRLQVDINQLDPAC